MDNNKQLGHVVSWKLPAKVSLDTVREAMALAGIPDDTLPELRPRHALSRALHDMTRGQPRIARRLPTDEYGRPRMQLTREHLEARGLEYEREAVVTLDGAEVLADEPEITAEATRLLQEHIAQRLTGDLTRLVQRTVERAGSDLIPIREQGGAYFIPMDAPVLAQLEALIQGIGGALRRFAVSLGHGSEASAAEVVTEYLAGLVTDFRASIADLGPDTRSDARAHRIARIAEIRGKLEAYRVLLAGEAAAIVALIAEAETDLMRRLCAPAGGGGGQLQLMAA